MIDGLVTDWRHRLPHPRWWAEVRDAMLKQVDGRLRDVERTRVNVTKAIRRPVRRITERDAAVGDHLSTTVRTGTFCAYHPGPDPARGRTVRLSVAPDSNAAHAESTSNGEVALVTGASPGIGHLRPAPRIDATVPRRR